MSKPVHSKQWNLSQFRKVKVPRGSLPKASLRYRAFELTPPNKVKVIILGQDPYHTPGKANGLAFGISPEWKGRRWHSSFENICKELGMQDGIYPSVQWASLESWAEQGVLLLNTRLSVAPGKPMSHAGIGWEDAIESLLIDLLRNRGILCVAWGAEARKMFQKVRRKLKNEEAWNSFILSYSHPCKYSYARSTKNVNAFKDSGCFDHINYWLEMRFRKKPIKWS